MAPEEQEDAIGVEAEAVAAAAAALVNEATQQSGGPMSTRPSLVMPPQTLIECNEEVLDTGVLQSTVVISVSIPSEMPAAAMASSMWESHRGSSHTE